MNARIFGVKSVNFTDKNTGEVISGTKIFFGFPDENVSGLQTDSAFLTSRRLNGFVPQPDQLVSIEYNRFGKVQNIVPVDMEV